MNYKNFSFLLILCDDAQEWGRKFITELYVNSPLKYTFNGIHVSLKNEEHDGKYIDIASISIDETYCNVKNEETIKSIFNRFLSISRDYNEIFRDGQETGSRNFEFAKKTIIDNGKNDESVKIHLVLEVSREKASTITAQIVASEYDSDDAKRFLTILSSLFGKDPDGEHKWASKLTDFK